MKEHGPIHRGSEWDASKERIHMPVSPVFVPTRQVVARPIIEAEATWWEDGSRVVITVRREVMGESPDDAMRHVQRIIDIMMKDLEVGE